MRLRETFVSILLLLGMFAPIHPVYALPVQCYCVGYLNRVLGVDVHGNANTLRPNRPLSDVQAGDVILLRYGSVSHAAVATKVRSKGDAMADGSYHTQPIEIEVRESNYVRCKATTRTLSISDPHIRGILRV